MAEARARLTRQLRAVARRDLPRLQVLLEKDGPAALEGFSAVHAAAIVGWARAVPALAAAAAPLSECARVPPDALQLLQPDEACAAALRRLQYPAPLTLAVALGRAPTAAALVDAGAEPSDPTFRLLLDLRRRGGSGAEADAAVRRLARALLRGGLRRLGTAAKRAHAVAAELAWPRALGERPLRWLERRLLRLHRAEAAAGARASVPPTALARAAEAVLARAAAADAAAFRDWLAVPAAASAGLGIVLVRACQALAEGGDAGQVAGQAALLLLARAPTRRALAAEAEAGGPPAGGACSRGARVLALSALAARGDVLGAALAAGARVDVHAVNEVLRWAGGGPSGSRLRGLRLLLAQGAPPVPLEGAASPTVCPIYCLLDAFAGRLARVQAAASAGATEAAEHAEQLQLMEALVAAGAPAACPPAPLPHTARAQLPPPPGTRLSPGRVQSHVRRLLFR